MTIPRAEAATVQPCEDDACPYTEGVRGGYRGIDRADVHYPFGHGLSYATFELEVLEATAGDVTAVLKHVAGPGGSAVVQVYGSEPSRLLAFEKRFLDEGDEDVLHAEAVDQPRELGDGRLGRAGRRHLDGSGREGVAAGVPLRERGRIDAPLACAVPNLDEHGRL